MKERMYNTKRQSRFSIRKLSVGTCSVLIGSLLLGAQVAQAEEATATETTATTPATTEESVVADESVEAMEEYKLHYNRPAATTYEGWEHEALPIGNGEIGSKLFGLIGGEHIQFNEKSLWSGGPKDGDSTYNGGNFEGKHAHLPAIREALEKGDLATAKQLATRHLVGPDNPQYGRYLAFGEIDVDIKGAAKTLDSVTDYRRELDITTAIASTSYTQDGATHKRESFVSYPDDVSVTHFTKVGDKPMDLTVKLNMTDKLVQGSGRVSRYKNEKSTFKEGTVTYENEGVLLSGHVKNNGLRFASYVGVDTDGTIERHDDRLEIKNATYATLLMSAKTNFAQNPKTGYRREVDVDASVKNIVNAAKAKKYEAIKKDHVEDYQALFNRVKLDITPTTTDKPTNQLLREYNQASGQQLEELFFQYGRYLMITSSRNRENSLPANLQGVWNGVDNPPWSSDYHLNVNLQMNYWPVYSTNIAETAIPLINFVDDLRHFGRVAAKEYANIVSGPGEENGWLAHTQATPFGWTTPGWSYYWGWSPASNAWIMQNVYDYYKFTKDEEYLRNKIYPMLKETAKFWNSFLHYDKESDRFVSSPSYSPEHGTITIGNTYDQSLVWQLFHDYMEAAKILKVDEDLVTEIKAKFDKLKPLHINEAGRIKEWFEEDTPKFTGEGVQQGHRHVSELVGLYPGTLFSKDTPEYLEAARNTLNHRGDGGTGWSKANKINLWARLLDGNRAHRLLSEQLKSSTLNNLWDTHAPFQIDGNFGATSGIAEMLLQSHTGYIAPLPALPDAWGTGKVSGLVARGNVEVDMKWKDKNLTNLKLQAKKGGDIQIDYPGIDRSTVKVNGVTVQATVVKDNRISVTTKPGDVITVENITGRVANVTATRQSNNSSQVNFEAYPEAVKYTIVREDLNDTNEATRTQHFTTTKTTFEDKAIVPSSQYRYSVKAHLSDGYVTPISQTVEIPNVVQIMDDRHPSIQYGSEFGNWADSVLYGGTEKFADLRRKNNVPEENATATIPFSGTGIEIYGLKTRELGSAFVTIDGVDKGEINFNNSSTQKGVLISRFDGLTDGPHTLKIRVKPRNKISLDFFKVLTNITSQDTALPPKVADVAADKNEVNVTLPAGEWDRVEVRIATIDEPVVINRSNGNVSAQNHAKVMTKVDGQTALLTLPNDYVRTEDRLVSVHAVRGAATSSVQEGIIFKRSTQPSVTPTTPVETPKKDDTTPTIPVETPKKDDTTPTTPVETPKQDETTAFKPEEKVESRVGDGQYVELPGAPIEKSGESVTIELPVAEVPKENEKPSDKTDEMPKESEKPADKETHKVGTSVTIELPVAEIPTSEGKTSEEKTDKPKQTPSTKEAVPTSETSKATSSEQALPETGEEAFAIFGLAAMSILSSVGLVSSTKKSDEG